MLTSKLMMTANDELINLNFIIININFNVMSETENLISSYRILLTEMHSKLIKSASFLSATVHRVLQSCVFALCDL